MLPSPKIATSRPCCTTSALPISSSFGAAFGTAPVPAPRGITDGDWPGVVVGHRPEHVDEFVFILRLHVDEVRDMPEIADIEKAVMRRAVVAAESRAIHAKRDVQVLERDVVNDHVVGALHEGRIDREERLQALGGQAAGEERRVFLRDADVEVTGRMLRLEKAEARSARHGGGDRDDLFVRIGKLRQRLAHQLRIGRRAAPAPFRRSRVRIFPGRETCRASRSPARNPFPFWSGCGGAPARPGVLRNSKVLIRSGMSWPSIGP